ncbi:MAG: tRNA (adenosine(37)-N6)-threonylcarbamoyltransferase complex dimerization subunit type 1 TsaB, partial [Planctomycetota bacterium]|nr:tRNA (adenosine(37)-N6)-threonylcarbamoyltransferase complex dimerization subunit type 1 TsaB [Planctomycetota bacterium]
MSLPVLLAIETSQRVGGVALRDREGTIHVEVLNESKRHDDDLMPAIDRMFSKAGLTPRDLEAVAISIGPGGFTGLRIAITTAKMFAQTLGVKLLAIPSAEVVAQSMEDEAGPILITLAGKGDNAWITHLVRTNGLWEILGEPGLMDAGQLDLEAITILVADQYLPAAMRKKAQQVGVPIHEPKFDPQACLLVGSRFLQAGLVTEPGNLNPLYPRPPEAVSIWEQRKAKSDA